MPIILILAVLAVLFFASRASASTAGGYGDAREAPPIGPQGPVTLEDYFETHPPPTIPGKYTVYDAAGQPTPLRATVAQDGTTKLKIPGIPYSYTVPGTVPAPPPPPPRTDGGAPPPPPVYGGSTVYQSDRSGAGHFN